MKKFEVGKTYEAHSICNYDCLFRYTVTKRTACTVTMVDKFGAEKRYHISKTHSNEKAEAVLPLGSYSMAPVLHADDVAV